MEKIIVPPEGGLFLLGEEGVHLHRVGLLFGRHLLFWLTAASSRLSGAQVLRTKPHKQKPLENRCVGLI